MGAAEPLTLQSSWQNSWLAAVAPDEPHKFDRRLEWDALSKEDFFAALNSEPASLEEDDPCFEETLQDALEALKAAWDLPLLPVDNSVNRPFVDLWWPIRCHSADFLKFSFLTKTLLI